MKRLLILLALMGTGIYLMLNDSDKRELEKEGKRIKKKLKKSHFPKQVAVPE